MLQKPTLQQLLYLTERIVPAERAEFEALSFGAYSPERHAVMLWKKIGLSHVFVDDDGNPYYAAGFEIGTPGVAIAWSVSTEACAAHVLDMTRTSRKVIKGLLASSVHRVQMMCLANRQEARRWYEALGADLDSTFKHLGRNGEDFVMYAIFREGI